MKIKGIMQRLTGVIAGLTLASVMLLATAGNAWAEDKVYLKDGRVLEGEIIREVNGSVWLSYSIGGVEQKGAFFASGLIDRIERDAAGDLPPSEPLQAAKASTTKVSPRKPGEHRGVVISLDRQERGRGALSAIQEVRRDYGIEVASVVTLSDLIAHLDDHPDYAQQMAALQDYRTRYGV